MSKIAIIGILILALIPVAVFVAKGHEAEAPVPYAKHTQQYNASSSPQCALCSQIQNGESKEQCLHDFMCS